MSFALNLLDHSILLDKKKVLIYYFYYSYYRREWVTYDI